MELISKKDLLIVTHLRKNARETLTMISKKTRIPISTIYDRLRMYQGNLIKRYVSLIDFNLIGFNTRAHVMIKLDKDSRDSFKDYVIKHQNVNSVFKINNGYDFLIEGIFRHIKDLEDFLEILETKFKILKNDVYYIVEDLKQEAFMADPITFGLVGTGS